MNVPITLLFLAALSQLAAQEAPAAITFGTTVVSSSGFRGKIYHLKEGTEWLPRLDKMRPVGTIYTNAINVPAQEFQRGFPGITERFEWFGIQYEAKIWIETEGRYGFTLLSDDGSQLSIDRKMMIDNDGIHQPQRLDASAVLTRGVHEVLVSYFQGPRYHVALMLGIVPPGGELRVLNTDDFSPPKDTGQWVAGRIREIRKAENPWPAGPPMPHRR